MKEKKKSPNLSHLSEAPPPVWAESVGTWRPEEAAMMTTRKRGRVCLGEVCCPQEPEPGDCGGEGLPDYNDYPEMKTRTQQRG